MPDHCSENRETKVTKRHQTHDNTSVRATTFMVVSAEWACYYCLTKRSHLSLKAIEAMVREAYPIGYAHTAHQRAADISRQ